MITLKKLSNLDGRRALVTGAGGNLGKTIAITLAELGADLILVDRSDSDLVQLSIYIKKQFNIQIECRVHDLESDFERASLIKDVTDSDKGLNILVNNAAFIGASNLEGWSVPFKSQSLQTWRRAIDVNLTAVFDLCQGFSSLLSGATGGTIINIGSIYGFQAPDWGLYSGTEMGNPAAYSASKGGLLQLTRWLSTAVAPAVRVNAISPGGIFRNQPAQFVDRYEKKTPLGRMATEDDFRGAIAYLASDMSRYVTGHNLVVDGGWSVW